MKIILVIILIMCYLSSFSQETGTFTDKRDGKTYKTVKIGTQTWFAENLAFYTFPGCWAYDIKSSNATKYGYLYKWETAKTVCPAGWHLPSDAEWTVLTNYLGGESVAGGKLKATTDWKYSANGNATNESGFNVLPAGARYYDGSFYEMGSFAAFWSSSPGKGAWARCLYYYDSEAYRTDYRCTFGYSVRCIRD